MQTNPILPQGELSLDCRGLQCPAPILKLADVTRQHRGRPMILGLQATDPDFLTDLEAWCRTTKSRLVESREEGGVIFATVAIHGAVAPAAAPLAAPAFASPPVSSPTPFSSTLSSPGSSASVLSSSTPSSAGSGALDLRGLPVNAGMRRLAAEALQGGERRLRVLADAPEFEARLYAWATASGARLERVLTVNGQTTADLLLLADDAPPASALTPRAPQAAAPQPLAASQAFAASQPLAPTPLALAPQALAAAPAMPLAPAALAPPVPAATLEDATGLGGDVSVRENRATLLVLRNDLESLLSALMVANSSASQGMDVEVYFAFWGINLLRGERRRPGDEKQPGILQRMMRWMMPRGPRRQKLSKMHWGGIGKFMLELFMRQRNVLSLEQLMKEAEQQNVQLKVCSMSMGVMGIQKADLMDLPNLSFGGVTSFSESARRSSFSLVF
jgi:peroxiredoxin family protein/TusA-related sulfurtransferase